MANKDQIAVNAADEREPKAAVDADAVLAAGGGDEPVAIKFFRENGFALAIGAGVLIVVVILGVAYFLQRERGFQQAEQMLAMAQNPKQMEDVLTQYPASPSAPVALLALASAAYHSGNFDQALGRYLDFLAKYPTHIMAPAAELGKVMCQEARGETDLALGGFDAFLVARPGHFLAPQASLGKARCLQQQRRYDEARAVLEGFIAAHSKSEWAPQAESALTFLKKEARSWVTSASAPAAPAVAIPAMTLPTVTN